MGSVVALSPLSFLDRSARVRPGKVAVIYSRRRQRPKAFVLPRPGSSTTVTDLTAHVRTKIAGYKTLCDIDITVKLPKTSTQRGGRDGYEDHGGTARRTSVLRRARR